MANKTTGNLAQLSLNIDQITPEFLATIARAGQPILWGGVGVGKTDVCTVFATNMTKRARATDASHPGYEFSSVILSQIPPEDIGGLPIVDREERRCYTTRPAFMGDPDQRYILLFDEYNRAPQGHRNAVLQFLLTKKIHGHAMHPESIILIAANASKHDVVGLQRISYADRNRLIHINIETNFDVWSKWAAAHNVHPIVLGFLGNSPEKLVTEPTDAPNEAFATPRSWTVASKLLESEYFIVENNGGYDTVRQTRDQLAVALNGTIGATSAELLSYIDVVSKLPSPQQILDDKFMPKDFGQQYAAIAMVTSWLSRKKLEADPNAPQDASKVKVVPTHFNDQTWLQFCDLVDKYRDEGRAELRACGVRLLFRGLGFLYPNQPESEKNPIVVEHYCGKKGSKGELRLRDLLKEVVNYIR